MSRCYEEEICELSLCDGGAQDNQSQPVNAVSMQSKSCEAMKTFTLRECARHLFQLIGSASSFAKAASSYVTFSRLLRRSPLEPEGVGTLPKVGILKSQSRTFLNLKSRLSARRRTSHSITSEFCLGILVLDHRPVCRLQCVCVCVWAHGRTPV